MASSALAGAHWDEGGMDMVELIEFSRDWFAEVERTPGRLEQVAFRRGTRVRAEVCPVATKKGLPDVADLRFPDGSTAWRIPLTRILVVREQARAA